MPAISVIIPTYNHEEFIEQTLDSVLAQTFQDYEIIIVNDGSPDNTKNRISPYLERYSIHYLEQENKGQAVARNTGLNKSKGEFIAFLDDDDLWPVDKLEWQFKSITNSDLIAVGGTCGIIENAKKQKPKVGVEKMISFRDLFHGNPFVSPGQVLIRTDSLLAVGGFDESIWGTDDLDLWMRLSKTGDILKKPRLSLWYRKHSVNASRDRIRMLENSKRVIQKNAYSPSKKETRKLKRDGFRWIYNYAGREMVFESKKSLKKVRFKEFFQLMAHFLKAFFPHMFFDRTLIAAIGKDWLPNRIRDRYDLWQQK